MSRSAMLIQGGVVHDGERFIGRRDVLVRDGIIADLLAPEGRQPIVDAETIDATGCTVCPGFIECHSMVQAIEQLDGNDAFNLTAQGVTSCIVGNCGMSGTLRREDDFLRRLEFLNTARLGVNVGLLLGHNSLRQFIVRDLGKPSLPQELSRMEHVVTEALAAGALGISTGLMYAPGSFADQNELKSLIGAAAKQDRICTSHIRDEGDRVDSAVLEALDLGRATSARLVISHLKAAGTRNWGKAKALMEVVAQRRLVQDVYVSFYPYTATSTVLRALIPQSLLSDVNGDVLQLSYDSGHEPVVKREGLQRFCEHSWADVVVVSSGVGAAVGKSLADLAGNGRSEYHATLRLLHQDPNTRAIFYNVASAVELAAIAKYPWTLVVSDGYVYRTGEKEATHPRNYGAFAVVLSEYVREGVMTVEEFIRRVTSLAAGVFRLERRGKLRRGFHADVAIFAPDRVRARSHYLSPAEPAEGMQIVIVNGQVVLKDGRATAALPGTRLS